MPVRGVREFQAALAGIEARALAATRLAATEGAHLVERAAKEKLTESSHPRGTPTPSVPGEPPSLVTGTLRRSIQVGSPRFTGSGYLVEIGPTVIYGRAQELGSGPLPARPFLGPALRESLPELHEIYRQAWKRAIKP